MPLPRPAAPRPGRRLLTLALCLCVCGAAIARRLTPSAGAASTFVVNSDGDGADANTSDNLCNDGSGNCTLRAAIQQANATPGADVVNFNLGKGALTIAPAAGLPGVTEAVTIDATTQPGYAGSPVVVLSGASAGPDADGLIIFAGPSAVRGLVVNGFRSAGVRLAHGEAVLAGNYVGTDASGASAFGNGTGVVVTGDGALVGGAGAADRNVISGNGAGVVIFGSNAAVRGNYIGVAADGSSPLPNAGDGVSIRSTVNTHFGIVSSDAHDNSVGGVASGQANVIAFNGGNGIAVSEHRHGEVYNRANTFRGNSLHSNGLHGISLARPSNGVEANDPSDADEGPNGLQNHPVLAASAPSGGGTNVSGSLDSRPGTTYALDFYASPACDGSGQGEGQAYVGSAGVTTDAAGRAAFDASLPSVPAALPVLTATATDPSGNTSEFSPCLDASAPATVQFKRTAYEASETAAPAVVVTVTRTVGSSSGAASVDYATSDGTARAGLDYVAAAGTVNFAPGETVRSFAVQLVNDPTDEETQAFSVTLGNPAGGVALGGNGTASVQILDDDRIPLAEVDNTAAAVFREGDSGTTPAVFRIRLARASEKPLTVSYTTRNGIALPPEDYEEVSGELTFAPGETVKAVTVNVRGDTLPEPQENFFFRVVAPTEDGRGFISSASGFIFDDDGAPGVHFAAADYEVSETAGHLDVRVVRRGDTSSAASVEYRVGGGSASAHDYTAVGGRLDFAPGETEKSFVLLVNDDAFVEEPEQVVVGIEGGVAGPLGSEVARVTITSDDAQPPTPANNPVDRSDFFVRQHYHDFLAREPDPEGFAFWTGQIDACGADAECRRVMRASVSAAFFLSIEFQRTGFQVFRAYAATYPEHLNTEASRRVYQLAPMSVLFDNTAAIRRGVVVGAPGWEQRLRDNTLDFARGWVERAEFKTYFPADTQAAGYVNALFSNAGVAPTTAEREAAEAAFGAGGTEGRAAALLSATNSRTLYNSQYNAAFVAMQYYGYLRRAPHAAPDSDFTGFDFWLAKLDAFSLPGEDVRDDSVAAARAARAEMARAFVESAEYRARFGTP